MVEQLERRRLMSGDVFVRLEDGWLRVEGDGSDNVVIIERSKSDPSAVVVRAGEGTTLNGGIDVLTFDGEGVLLRVELGGGNDELTLTGLDSAGRARINMGGGSDRTLVEDVRLSGAFGFRDLGGRSEAVFDSLDAGGVAEVATGDGADSLAIRRSDFRRDAAISTGAADDYVRIRGTTFAQNAPIDDGEGEDHIDRELIFDWDFRRGAQGWRGDFSDYAVFDSGPGVNSRYHYRLQKGLVPLPAEGGLKGTGHLLSSSNGSDDMFMYLSRVLTAADGLLPSTRYELSFEIRFESNLPAGLDGVGGSPAESNFLKAGGVGRKPRLVREPNEATSYLNVDKYQGSPGRDLSPLGDIRNGRSTSEPNLGMIYTVVRRRHRHWFPVATNAAGSMWVLVGTDSGFEGITTLYYTRISLKLTPVDR